jgi:uncharacterized membrane protein YbhN (UPF0104 family)
LFPARPGVRLQALPTSQQRLRASDAVRDENAPCQGVFWQVYSGRTSVFWRCALPKTQGSGKTRHLSLIARIAVAAVAIVWVLHGQDWTKLGQVFRRLSLGYFALSLATFSVAQVVLAVRWWVLLRTQGIHITIRTAVRLFFLGLYFNNLMPGSVGGDLLKAWYITKHTDKRLAGALSVVVDRVIGLVGLILMAAFTYLLFVRGPLAGQAPPESAAAQSSLAGQRNLILWVVVGILAVLAAAMVWPYSRARLMRIAKLALHRGVGLMHGVRDAVVAYCSKPLAILWAMLLTFISQSTVIVAFWLLGRNLGMEAALKHYFLVFPVMWTVGAVPVSLAGLGIVEGGIVEMFVRLAGVAPEKALALALCQRVVWILASLPGAAVHLLGAHLPREICLDGGERAS